MTAIEEIADLNNRGRTIYVSKAMAGAELVLSPGELARQLSEKLARLKRRVEDARA